MSLVLWAWKHLLCRKTLHWKPEIWPKQWKKLRILTLISMVELKVYSASQTCYPFVTCLFMTYLWEFNWWAEQDTGLLFTNCLIVPSVVNARMLFVHGWFWTAYVVAQQLLNVSVLALAYFHGVVSVVVGRWEVFCLASRAIAGEEDL